MESRFAHDFSRVRVHTSADAGRLTRSLGAVAYTSGNDIAFDAGRFEPGSPDGRRLLAHELAHVVQQSTIPGRPTIQLKAIATRFQDEPTLEAVSDGKRVLKAGDRGEAVIRITTALSELGHYKSSAIDEIYGSGVTTAVKSFQSAKGLTGSVPAGRVEKKTFDKLDQDFAADFKVERDVLSRQKSADILKETQPLDAAERKAGKRAVSTETRPDPVTGLPPKFRPTIVGKGKYGDRLRVIVDAEILSQWTNMGKGKTAAHAKAGALYGAADLDPIALEAEAAVRAVFGEYITGVVTPHLKLGVNIEDAWAKKEKDLTAGGKKAEDDAVSWRVQKILDGDDAVKALDDEHGAIQTRSQEAAIIAPIKADLMKKYRAELLETHKAWPGFEDKGIVYVQLFKGSSVAAQRRDRWEYFQTFIHEYIHSLESGKHITYRESLAEKRGGFTLREGTTDYFTKIVWSRLTITPALRKAVEGTVYDPKHNFPIPPLNTYPEAINAERLAGVVGIRNVAAAFFLGKTSLVGGP